MDISVPSDPVLMWSDSPTRVDPSLVDEKNKMRLVEIADIKAGASTEVFKRSGSAAEAGKYMSFTHAETKRTLDVEFPCPEAAEWAFKKVNLLFNAYFCTQQEKLKEDAVTVRVVGIVDGGASPTPATPAAKAKAAAATAASTKKTAPPPSAAGAAPTPGRAAALYPTAYGGAPMAGLGSPVGRAYTPVHPSLQGLHAAQLRAMGLHSGSARGAGHY